jgi:hypothetical protein
LGRGSRSRASRGIRYWSRSDDPVWAAASPDANVPFADALDRITELFESENEAFPLSPAIGIPALDLFRHPHRDISRAHGELLRASMCPERLLTGRRPGAVDVRLVDLTGSLEHTRALLVSVALLVQPTNKSDLSVAIPAPARDGLIGEALTDAYFTAMGWQSVSGVGAFYRGQEHTFGARLVQGNGLDHLFRRGNADLGEYLAVETKVCRGNAPLDAFLLRQFAEERLRQASAESYGVPTMSSPWVLDRLRRAFLRGSLSRADYERAVRAEGKGRLRRAIVLVTCPEYDRPLQVHAPDPDALARPAGQTPMADEVITLRVPKPILTTLVADISSCRARSIATMLGGAASEPLVTIDG